MTTTNGSAGAIRSKAEQPPEYSLSGMTAELSGARAQTDALFSSIHPEALFDRPIAERHRIVFYIGHLDAFDINQLRESGVLARSYDSDLDRLFAFGIDPEPGRLPGDSVSDWPSLPQVRRYSQASRALVDASLAQAPPDVAHMLVEHRHMHAETLAYILHNLDTGKKSGPLPQLSSSAPPAPEMIVIPAGIATLGRNPEDGFGWDNEFRSHSLFVPAFSIGKYKVSNAEYLEFVRQGASVPHYWSLRNGRWFYRAVFGELPLPPAWPVYVTLDQARAYAAFRGCRIPTEAEYHRAAPETVAPDANLDYRHWDPVPITPSDGISQMVGNGWEWTDTVFAPFEGFTAHSSYPGYSANFFDGKHYVLKGASPRTAARLVRRSLRNWFRPEYPYVYATFRLCQL